MHRQIRLLAAVSLAIAAAACSRDSRRLLAPDVSEAPDSLGRLVFSSPSAPALYTPAWSEHRDAIYFIDPEDGLRELHLQTGVVRTLDEHGAYVAMAPNGRALYYRDRVAGGAGKLLRRFDLVTQALTVVSDAVSWFPIPSNGDGLVAYCRPVDYALMIAASSGSGADVVASRGFPLAFSPDDREFLYSKTPYPVLNDPLQVRDLHTGLVREVPIDVPGMRVGPPFWSRGGIMIPFTEPGVTTLWIRLGPLDRKMFAGTEYIDQGSLSWSPGGSRLAFLTYEYAQRGRILTAWVIEPETSRLFRVAHGFDQPHPSPDPAGMPSISYGNATTFSPDGRGLAYTSAGRIFIASID